MYMIIIVLEILKIRAHCLRKLMLYPTELRGPRAPVIFYLAPTFIINLLKYPAFSLNFPNFPSSDWGNHGEKLP